VRNFLRYRAAVCDGNLNYIRRVIAKRDSQAGGKKDGEKKRPENRFRLTPKFQKANFRKEVQWMPDKRSVTHRADAFR
jgi:hypothetical protein